MAYMEKKIKASYNIKSHLEMPFACHIDQKLELKNSFAHS